MRLILSTIFSILVLFVCLYLGLVIACQRPIENDEFYSQSHSIDQLSYGSQLAGRIDEGGNAPLFYTLQKLFLQGVHYQMPSAWLQGQWTNDGHSQVILRVTPIIFMSLSVALIFFYFSWRFSLYTAFFSLFTFLTSHLLWAFWYEARPYALWVFLTTVQSIILLSKADEKEKSRSRLWIWLAVANVLLSFTCTLSLGQITAVSILWWILKEREWKKYIWILIIPSFVALFYYIQAPKYHFFFSGNPTPAQIIWDNFTKDRLNVLFIFISLVGLFYFFKSKGKNILGLEILEPLGFIGFLLLMLGFSVLLLFLFGWHAQPNVGFAITSRYFIFLTPIGVMAMTLMVRAILKSLSKYVWAQILFIITIAVLFLFRLA